MTHHGDGPRRIKRPRNIYETAKERPRGRPSRVRLIGDAPGDDRGVVPVTLDQVAKVGGAQLLPSVQAFFSKEQPDSGNLVDHEETQPVCKIHHLLGNRDSASFERSSPLSSA